MKFTVDDWLKVTDRAIQLVGEDHVILGTDFDGGPTLPLPMRDIRDVPLITRRHAPPRLFRGADSQDHGRKLTASVPPDYRQTPLLMCNMAACYRHAGRPWAH